jgi:ascorbate-specific PTS system EIIC-type component UlaA
LNRALQRCDVDGVDGLVLETFAYSDGLLLAVWVQLWVAVAIDQGKRIFLTGGSGFAVTHQNDFGCAFRRLIGMLSKSLAHANS